jgi:hypothetical protein
MSNYWDEAPLAGAPPTPSEGPKYWEDAPVAPVSPLMQTQGVSVPPEKARVLEQQRKDYEAISPAEGGWPGRNLVSAFGSFWPYVGTALKQGAASIGFGDPEEARQQAAEQARLDRPLLKSPGGFIGKMLPEAGLATVGGMGRTGVEQFLGNTGMGLGLELSTPDPHGYSLGGKALTGTAIGAGSDLFGRLVSKAARPFTAESPGSRENSAIIEGAGLPRPLASTRAAVGGFAQPMTAALEQIPFISTWLKRNLDENARFFTRYVTRDTGTEVSHITDSTRRAMDDRLSQIADTFRATGNPADEGFVRQRIEAARQTLGRDLAATGSTDAIRVMDNAINALRPGQTIDAATLLDRRSHATQALYDSGTLQSQKRAYAAVRDAYDEAFLDANPFLTQPYRQWREQYGTFKDIIAAADKGLGRESTLLPQNVRSSTEFRGNVAQTPRERFIQAMDEQTPKQTGGWNRAGYIAMLLGNPIVGAGIPGFSGGDVSDIGWGGAAGAGLSASMVHGLSRRPVSAFTADMLRRAATLLSGESARRLKDQQ